VLPTAGLVQATNGDFYGTTSRGGDESNCVGCGTVFTVTPKGALTTLYSFCPQSGCTDGASPNAIVRAANGDFYGTTFYGGNGTTFNGSGTIFKFTPAGTLTTLYRFCPQTPCTDGLNPSAALVQGTNGSFYGTTQAGGFRYGTIFKITPAGTLATLHRFCAHPTSGLCLDGSLPTGLVQATNGNFYGTTYEGGANCTTTQGCGTVFEITPGGTLTTLYSFCAQSGCPDGSFPGDLVQGTDGNLYGATAYGGASDLGTVFKITTSGTLTTLYSFCSQGLPCPDGDYPAVAFQATNGNFYGTTGEGGANNDGTIFSLSVGLSPFVETLPNSGKVGAKVKILGNRLTGATSVTFNGTAATFTVNSTGTFIATTVPPGATTGPVQVTTPSGTLSSNVPFRVP